MRLSLQKTKKQSVKLGLLALVATSGFLGAKAAQADSYVVKEGDTLSAIAASHQVSLEQLVATNQLANPNLLNVGQVLELGGTVATNTQETAASPSTTSGLSAEDAEAKEWIAQKESSGSYTAQNGQYYGRYQLTITYLNGDLSPENQERVADQYVTSRYGSWSAAKGFWLANGWY